MNRRMEKQIRGMQLFLLLLVLCSMFLIHLNYERGYKLFHSYVNLIPFLFLGFTLALGRGGCSVDLWLGYAWMGWFVLSRVLLKDLYLTTSSYVWFINYCCFFLLALPFARSADDVQHMRGLKLTAVFMLVVMLLSCLLGLWGMWSGEMVHVPRLGGYFGVEWHLIEYRLVLAAHPNTSGAMIVLAVLLGVWLMTCSRRWVTAVIVPVLLMLYVTCALTTSRTCMIQISAFLGMVAAVLLLRYPPKWLRGWFAQYGCAVLTAVVVFAVVFASFGWALDGVNVLKAAQQASVESAETEAAQETEQTAEPEAQITRRDLGKDLTSMTGRTGIFKRAFKILRENPKMLLFGTIHRDSLEVGAVNAHNSYIQVLMCLGVPGLLLAILFTVRILWLCLKMVLVHLHKASLAQLIIACMLPAMLLNTITEPILFYDMVPIYSVVFFVAYGYLSETERRLRVA